MPLVVLAVVVLALKSLSHLNQRHEGALYPSPVIIAMVNELIYPTLQNVGVLGRIFLGHVCKNAAPNRLKPRFLKTRLKEKTRVVF